MKTSDYTGRPHAPALPAPVSRPVPVPANDPRPLPPEPPLPSDCCDSGCDPCVNDLYTEELQDYRQRLAAWLERHPEAGAGG